MRPEAWAASCTSCSASRVAMPITVWEKVLPETAVLRTRGTRSAGAGEVAQPVSSVAVSKVDSSSAGGKAIAGMRTPRGTTASQEHRPDDGTISAAPSGCRGPSPSSRPC